MDLQDHGLQSSLHQHNRLSGPANTIGSLVLQQLGPPGSELEQGCCRLQAAASPSGALLRCWPVDCPSAMLCQLLLAPSPPQGLHLPDAHQPPVRQDLLLMHRLQQQADADLLQAAAKVPQQAQAPDLQLAWQTLQFPAGRLPPIC